MIYGKNKINIDDEIVIKDINEVVGLLHVYPLLHLEEMKNLGVGHLDRMFLEIYTVQHVLCIILSDEL